VYILLTYELIYLPTWAKSSTIEVKSTYYNILYNLYRYSIFIQCITREIVLQPMMNRFSTGENVMR